MILYINIKMIKFAHQFRMNMPNTVIIGTGSYVPQRVIDASSFMDAVFYDDNHQRIDKPNDEIVNKFIEITEIKKRRYAEDFESNSDLGAKASEAAISDAGIDREKIDYIIYATNFGEVTSNGIPSFMPNTAARLKNKLGIKNLNCITYDMIFGCPGWVEGMSLADTLIKACKAKTILVVGGEVLSRTVDPYDRDRMIFADGAGAVVVSASEDSDSGIISESTICFNGEELSYLETGPSLNLNHCVERQFVRMRGRKIYEFALKYVPNAIKNTIDKAGLTINDISKILIHQANAKMDHAIINRLHKLYGIKSYDQNISPMTVQEFGNSSVATIPTMFDLIKRGKMEGHSFKKGDNIVFASVGAGMNINAIVYRY